MRFATFEDACRAVDELEASEAAHSAAGGPTPALSDSEDEHASQPDNAGSFLAPPACGKGSHKPFFAYCNLPLKCYILIDG